MHRRILSLSAAAHFLNIGTAAVVGEQHDNQHQQFYRWNNPSPELDIYRRQGPLPGYHPEFGTCGSGTTCENACGSSWELCKASTSLSLFCYNRVELGQTCCENGSGRACERGYYCAWKEFGGKTWCCRDGQSLEECGVDGIISASSSASGSSTSASSASSSLAPSGSSTSGGDSSYTGTPSATSCPSVSVVTVTSTETVTISQSGGGGGDETVTSTITVTTGRPGSVSTVSVYSTISITVTIPTGTVTVTKWYGGGGGGGECSTSESSTTPPIYQTESSESHPHVPSSTELTTVTAEVPCAITSQSGYYGEIIPSACSVIISDSSSGTETESIVTATPTSSIVTAGAEANSFPGWGLLAVLPVIVKCFY